MYLNTYSKDVRACMCDPHLIGHHLLQKHITLCMLQGYSYNMTFYEYNIHVVSDTSTKPNPVFRLIDGVSFTSISSTGVILASNICRL